MVIFFLRLIHPEIILKEFTFAQHKENKDQFRKIQGQGIFSQEMTCRNLQEGRPSTMSSLIFEEFPHNSIDGQQGQQISELQFDKFLNPQSFWVWKIRFKNQVTTCSDHTSEAMSWIKDVRWLILLTN